jgi:hypothetical protein
VTVNPDGILDDVSVGIHAGTQQRLADAIRRLVEDRGLRDQMSERAILHARKHHSMKNAEKLVQMIEREVLNVEGS